MARSSIHRKHISTKIGITILGFLLVALVLAIPMLKKAQDVRSHASASTTLYLKPIATASSPIVKNVGDTVPLDVIIQPGKNLPTFVKLEILFDSTKLKASSSAFVNNKTAFPSLLEGPVVNNGQILVTLSVGPNPANAIAQETMVGTVNFTVISPITTPTAVTFGAKSAVLSIGQSDGASENVLSTTNPTYISTQPTTVVCKEGVNSFSVSGNCGTGGSYYASFTCYDGFNRQLGNGASCVPISTWKIYAEQACKGHTSCSGSPTPQIVTPTPYYNYPTPKYVYPTLAPTYGYPSPTAAYIYPTLAPQP